jgi:cytochrome c biogenesis protein CcdA/glutaredoxin
MWALPVAGHAATTTDDTAEPVELVLFWGEGCPHCAAEKEWLTGIAAEHPDLVIRTFEVFNDPTNQRLFEATASEYGVTASGVPTTFLGEQYWVGFSESIATDMETSLEALLLGTEAVAAGPAVDVPGFGEVALADQSLLVSTLIIGFVDGVNPCSLWVLSVLLAIVLHTGSRRRVFAVGTVFLTITAALYGLYITGMYSALDYVSEIEWIRFAVAAVALVFGLIHLKDFFWFKQGVSLSIPEGAKPGIYQRMRRLASPDRSLPAILAGTVVLAAGVSLLETPCTAGLPLLWTNLLAAQEVPFGEAAALFAVYMAVFLVDELIVFGAAVFTLRAARVQERHGRALKLTSGVVMVTLALVLLTAPQLLESATGALLVFLAAGLIVAIVLLGERLRTVKADAV